MTRIPPQDHILLGPSFTIVNGLDGYYADSSVALGNPLSPVATSPVIQEFSVSKRTFQPNNRRRAKVHGFRTRMRTRSGRAVIAARRHKGRARLSA